MTVTDAKREANRLNARKSTGPRTPRGKAIAAQNALRHGIYARPLLLDGESGDSLTELKTAMIRRLNPRDALELGLVERVVAAMWKLRRIERYESHLYEKQTQLWEKSLGPTRESLGLGRNEPIPADIVWRDSEPAFKESLDRLAAAERHLDNTIRRTLRDLTQLQKTEPPEELNEFAAKALAADAENGAKRQQLSATVETFTLAADLDDSREQRLQDKVDAIAQQRLDAEKTEIEAKARVIAEKIEADREYAEFRRYIHPDVSDEEAQQILALLDREPGGTADPSVRRIFTRSTAA